MSELIKATFSGFFKISKFLLKGYVLEKDVGARFSSSKEQKEILNSFNKGLLIDGKNKRLSEKDSFEHIAIIAKPGGGKTTGYIIPNILDKSNQNCSMLITDPSGEIFGKTSGHLKSKGFNIVCLDPGDLRTSARFNPFDGLNANHIIEIEQVCSSIILSKYGSDKEPVWNEGAISLLEIFAKCLAYSCPDYLNLPNLNYLIQMFGNDGSNLDDWVVEHSINPLDSQDKSIVNSWIGITASNPNMLSSYTTIVKTALKQLNNRNIQKLLSTNDIDFTVLRKKKTAIYLSFPENQQQYFQFIIDVFYSRFFSVMMSSIPKKSELNVYCFLDEFGNAYVNDFQTIVNNIRKYRVSLSLVLQGISQLNEKYGDMTANSIKSGISNYMIFAGADYKTAKEQSEIIGKKVLIQRNGFEEIVDRYNQIELLSADKIRTLNKNQVLFLSANRHPFIIEFQPYYESFIFSSMTKKQVFNQPENTSNNIFKQLHIKGI